MSDQRWDDEPGVSPQGYIIGCTGGCACQCDLPKCGCHRTTRDTPEAALAALADAADRALGSHVHHAFRCQCVVGRSGPAICDCGYPEAMGSLRRLIAAVRGCPGTTRDTPEAAHRAEYDRALGGKSRARTLPGEHKDGIAKSALTLAVRTAWGCDYPRSTGGHQTCGCTDERIAAIISALPPGWSGHDDGLLSDLVEERDGERARADLAEVEIARLRAALAEIVAMERYVTSPTRLDLMVTLGRALDVAKGALGLLEPLAALAPSEP